jgi:hypothetical protein
MYPNQKLVCIHFFVFVLLLTVKVHFSDDLKDNDLQFSWRNVSVREYNTETQRWRVSPDDREHNVFDMYRPVKRNRKPEAIEQRRESTENAATNGKFKRKRSILMNSFFCIGHNGYHSSRTHGDYWVPRVQLHFLAEDPRVFADRVTKAFHDRKRTEAELRSALFIDCMPTDGIGKLDDERIKRMIELTKTSVISKTVYENLLEI